MAGRELWIDGYNVLTTLEAALAGGVILGVAQAIGAQINPGWQILAGHIVFLLVLAVRRRVFWPLRP